MHKWMILLVATIGIHTLGYCESVQFRYVKFSVLGSLVTGNSAWDTRGEDSTELLNHLFNLSRNQQASIVEDKTILLHEMDVEYVVESDLENIQYASEDGSTNAYVLKEWDEPVGNKMVVCQKYRPLKGTQSLCIELWAYNSTLIRRKAFLPFPMLQGGEPVIKTSRQQDSGFFWNNENQGWFLSHSGVDDEWVITLCQVKKVKGSMAK